MTDILLSNDLDLVIDGGDLRTCNNLDTDYQDLNLLLNINTGDNKQYPQLGTNLITWKNGEYDGLLNNLKTQFDFNNLPVEEVIIDNDKTIRIKMKGNYTSVSL
jgi:hypothetical protein